MQVKYTFSRSKDRHTQIYTHARIMTHTTGIVKAAEISPKEYFELMLRNENKLRL